MAHRSEFHFHRIFTAIVGEPIGRFISRRRLETAALRLAYQPERSVGDIALACGYSSISNFSKAFSAFFGCSPSQVRRPREALPESGTAVLWTKGLSKFQADYSVEFLPTNPWIHQPFESYDAMGPEKLIEKWKV